jgi:two-component system, NarL family, sensor histidine kinase DesK
MSRRTPRVDEAATEVEQIRELTRSALEQVRDAVGGYRRPTLPSELAEARVALEAAGIELQIEAPDDPLDPDVDAVLAWAVREGGDERDPPQPCPPGRDHRAAGTGDDGAPDRRRRRRGPAFDGGGHGQTGLRERAQAVGGTVEAGAGPGGGFHVTVRVPAAGRSDAAA